MLLNNKWSEYVNYNNVYLYIFMYLHQAETVHYSILYEECKCCDITVSGILTGK